MEKDTSKQHGEMCLNALFTRFVPVDEVAVELLIFAMTLFPSICSASSHGLRIFDIKQDPKLPLHNQSMQHVFCKVFSKLKLQVQRNNCWVCARKTKVELERLAVKCIALILTQTVKLKQLYTLDHMAMH